MCTMHAPCTRARWASSHVHVGARAWHCLPAWRAQVARLTKLVAASLERGECELVMEESELHPEPVRIEVSAAQQRVLGQVPTPPQLPPLGALLAQLRSSHPPEALPLEHRVAMWRQEVSWLQEELRDTALGEARKEAALARANGELELMRGVVRQLSEANRQQGTAVTQQRSSRHDAKARAARAEDEFYRGEREAAASVEDLGAERRRRMRQARHDAAELEEREARHRERRRAQRAESLAAAL